MRGTVQVVAAAGSGGGGAPPAAADGSSAPAGAAPAPSAPAGPELPNTGLDAVWLAVAGGICLLAGLLLRTYVRPR